MQEIKDAVATIAERMGRVEEKLSTWESYHFHDMEKRRETVDKKLDKIDSQLEKIDTTLRVHERKFLQAASFMSFLKFVGSIALLVLTLKLGSIPIAFSEYFGR